MSQAGTPASPYHFELQTLPGTSSYTQASNPSPPWGEDKGEGESGASGHCHRQKTDGRCSVGCPKPTRCSEPIGWGQPTLQRGGCPDAYNRADLGKYNLYCGLAGVNY